jgi:hypothetical protein
MTSTLIPAIVYLGLTQLLFGMVCYAWGYLKGRGYEYIEIKGGKNDK